VVSGSTFVDLDQNLGSLFCGSQSLRAIPAIFVSFATHAAVVRIFSDEQALRTKDVDGQVG